MTTLREAAQQALEAWEHINKYGFVLADYEGPMEQAITALKAALEQPEQEPVATVKVMGSYNGVPALGCLIDASATHVTRGDKLYTRPPRREWRSLSEEETAQVLGFGDYTARSTEVTLTVIARAIEAALRSKNHV
jgi:hypothetical protein